MKWQTPELVLCGGVVTKQTLALLSDIGTLKDGRPCKVITDYWYGNVDSEGKPILPAADMRTISKADFDTAITGKFIKDCDGNDING